MAEKIIKGVEEEGASEKRREKSRKKEAALGEENTIATKHVPLHLNVEHKTIRKVHNSNLYARKDVCILGKMFVYSERCL